MWSSGIALLLLVVTVYGVPGSAEIKEKVYQHLCDRNQNFRQKMTECLNIMPLEKQVILKGCAIVVLNITSGDYSRILPEMCRNKTEADQVSNCIHHFLHDHHHHHHKEDFDHHHDHEHDHDHSEEGDEEHDLHDSNYDGDNFGHRHEHLDFFDEDENAGMASKV
ncbi:hypothetical protein X975_02709, partial [Stegodyphus mimosarum]